MYWGISWQQLQYFSAEVASKSAEKYWKKNLRDALFYVLLFNGFRYDTIELSIGVDTVWSTITLHVFQNVFLENGE